MGGSARSRGRAPARPVAAAAGLLLLVAAGCDPFDDRPDPDDLELPGDTVRVTRLGDTAGISLGVAEVRRTAERRWLHDRAVLDSAALEEGFVVARGPGLAGIHYALPDGRRRDVVVSVRPEEPVAVDLAVPSPARPGDTAALRGYRMAELDSAAVHANGWPTLPVGSDSANYRFRIPPKDPDPSTCRGPGRIRITVDGIRAPEELSFRVRREDEIALAVGEARLLGEGVRCLRLAPRDSGRYALAYVDVDAIRDARDGPEGYPDRLDPPPALFTVRVEGRAAPEGAEEESPIPLFGAGARPGGPPRRGGRPAGVRVAPPAADPDRCPERDDAPCTRFALRTGPSEEGDTFRTDVPGGRSGTARVVEVVDGYLSVAVFEPDTAAFRDAGRASVIDAARSAVDRAVPLLESTLTADRPVTSPGAGQLLLVLSRFDADSLASGREVGLTYYRPDGRASTSWIALNLGAEWTYAGLLELLSHELAHAFSHQYLHAAGGRGSDRRRGNPTLWAEEGVAELLAHEVLRRAAGIGPTANYRGWRDPSVPPHAGRYGAEARYAVGTLTAGYDHAASFLRGLATRRRRAGENWDDAVAAVTRGALEGWFGYDEFGTRRTGLARRMRRGVDSTWTPVGGVLRWALSQALDDRTGSARFQNRAFAEVSGEHSCGCGWRPHATVTAGASDDYRVTRRYGSTGYFFVRDRGVGGSYRLRHEGTERPVRWMVARYR